MKLSLLVLALSTVLSAGSLTLTGFGLVSTVGNQMQVGVAGPSPSGCFATFCEMDWMPFSSLLGTVNARLGVATPMTVSGAAPDFTLIGGTGTFSMNDANETLSLLSDGFSASVNLTSAIETGPLLNDMTISGTLTNMQLGFNVSFEDQRFATAWRNAFAAAGIDPANGTALLTINVNCPDGGCINLGSDPSGVISSLVLAPAVPEPGAVLLVVSGLLALAWRRRLFNGSIR